MKIYFITSNPSKFLEARVKLKKVGIELRQKAIAYPEIQSDRVEDIAEFACGWLQERIKKKAIVEDSGLFIGALNEFPGPCASWAQKTIGNGGILRLMKNLPFEERRAHFKAVIGYIEKNKIILFTGECPGFISMEQRGTSGFGFDPIFIPEGEKRTFAEMSTEEKNKYSHRGKALDQLAKYLSTKI
jgi:XTP/dITP diphosphohydrolase